MRNFLDLLRQHRKLKSELAKALEKKASLIDCLSPGSKTLGELVVPTELSDTTAIKALKLVELEFEIKRLSRLLVTLSKSLLVEIEAVDEEIMKNSIKRYYIEGESWESVRKYEYNMYVSSDCARVATKRFLEKFQKGRGKR